jgi:translation initiation factor IF-2
MSHPQVERLEALLARVQRNRSLPRRDNAAPAPRPRAEQAPAAPVAAAPVPRPRVEQPPAAPPAAPAARPRVEQAPAAPVAAAPAPKPRAEQPPPAPIAPPAARPRTEQPQPAPASAPPRAKPALTPLEMALEGRAGQPATPLRQQLIDSVPPPAAAPMRDVGRVLAEPSTPEPSKPNVQVVSKQPPHAVASFGELLRRSLSLRPR